MKIKRDAVVVVVVVVVADGDYRLFVFEIVFETNERQHS